MIVILVRPMTVPVATVRMRMLVTTVGMRMVVSLFRSQAVTHDQLSDPMRPTSELG